MHRKNKSHYNNNHDNTNNTNNDDVIIGADDVYSRKPHKNSSSLLHSLKSLNHTNSTLVIIVACMLVLIGTGFYLKYTAGALYAYGISNYVRYTIYFMTSSYAFSYKCNV